MMAPASVAPPAPAIPSLPSPTQDPAAIVRQLQQQLPTAPGPISSPYGGPPPGTDPELLQEQMLERIQSQRDTLFQ